MKIESKLCHISENRVVVQVCGWVNEQTVGCALAEGSTVEIAEDKAISRLNQRYNSTNSLDFTKKINTDNNDGLEIKTESDDVAQIQSDHLNQEPNDWSNELTEIDLEIKRLNWSRNDEILFLEKNFGYNNRNKITKYNELIKYLNILKTTQVPNSSMDQNQTIKKLIEESDNILNELSWDHNKGREYLKREFNVSTRKELNHVELISFVSKLKTIRNQYLSQQ